MRSNKAIELEAKQIGVSGKDKLTMEILLDIRELLKKNKKIKKGV